MQTKYAFYVLNDLICRIIKNNWTFFFCVLNIIIKKIFIHLHNFQKLDSYLLFIIKDASDIHFFHYDIVVMLLDKCSSQIIEQIYWVFPRHKRHNFFRFYFCIMQNKHKKIILTTQQYSFFHLVFMIFTCQWDK
jgi:hypothetical protein